jgi:hypothetical protein
MNEEGRRKERRNGREGIWEGRSERKRRRV